MTQSRHVSGGWKPSKEQKPSWRVVWVVERRPQSLAGEKVTPGLQVPGVHVQGVSLPPLRAGELVPVERKRAGAGSSVVSEPAPFLSTQ